MLRFDGFRSEMNLTEITTPSVESYSGKPLLSGAGAGSILFSRSSVLLKGFLFVGILFSILATEFGVTFAVVFVISLFVGKQLFPINFTPSVFPGFDLIGIFSVVPRLIFLYGVSVVGVVAARILTRSLNRATVICRSLIVNTILTFRAQSELRSGVFMVLRKGQIPLTSRARFCFG